MKSISFHNAKVRIVLFLYPSTLAFIDNNEKLAGMVLFNNGSGDGGTNAATAFVADGQNVDGFHDEENGGGLIDGPWRPSWLEA
jgi:hypothetical protein